MVFEKLKLEGFAGHDDVRLKTSLRVPKVVVGRIIGKGGKNVRELQRVTGAMVKLPEDPTTQGDEVTVEVFGNFMSIQVSSCRSWRCFYNNWTCTNSVTQVVKYGESSQTWPSHEN